MFMKALLMIVKLLSNQLAEMLAKAMLLMSK